jgi:hypothetical protein
MLRVFLAAFPAQRAPPKRSLLTWQVNANMRMALADTASSVA